MGKTPKKAAPGGDERNLYVRRLKATTAPRDESSFLPERQREFESTNRPKLSGIHKKISTGSGKNLKSKLRASAKVGVNQAIKQLKLPMKSPKAATDMQPESEEAEVKLNVSIQKEEGIQEENGNNKSIEIEPTVDKEFPDIYIISEQTCEFQTPVKEVASTKEVIFEKEEILLESDAKEIEEQEENDIKLTYEVDHSPTKNEESSNNKDNNKEDELSAAQTEDELQNTEMKYVNEKEDPLKEAQTNNDTYSVDIVESTTSEISETPESVIQSNVQKDKAKIDDTTKNDISFISYDSSIMLKNVQIRLNDCLKNNPNLFDESDKLKDIELKISKYLTKDMSYGKTLHELSGRRKLYDRRISPNSSLFVNTSTVSSQDVGVESKILHCSSILSDSFPTNGNPLDRKRKINETEEYNTMKKQKTDDDRNLSKSPNLFKYFKRSTIKVSTPKPTSYNFEPCKLDISGIKDDDNKIMAESTDSTNKWCVIM